jgi:BMFP domain-containing protein YqiC
MQTSNRLLDDVARLANGLLGVAAGLRSEAEGVVRARLQALLADTPFVSREDFEAMREMAMKARLEQELLKEKLASLEQRLAALERTAPASSPVPPAPAL